MAGLQQPGQVETWQRLGDICDESHMTLDILRKQGFLPATSNIQFLTCMETGSTGKPELCLRT